jgi:small-conductance mechanosensitive channel
LDGPDAAVGEAAKKRRRKMEEKKEIERLKLEIITVQKTANEWWERLYKREEEIREKEKEIEYLKAKTKTLESELERSNHNFSASNQCAAELSQKLAEKEKEIRNLHEAIEKAAIDIWNTKSIFGKWHSKTLEKIRKELMSHLPTETQIKLYNIFGLGPPNPRPEPPPRLKSESLPVGHNPPPLGPKPPPPPGPPPPKGKLIIIGYQPESDDSDPKKNPPQGGSGLK